ncbi:hypothetical protein O181_045177 [Austropuccinia psidii MF-1]|uniref:Uncharacterized protein n=1 Tax=Austropuccinia psidii MF-1 TaxID=1389203 RepID=A0A9Q3DNV6_9BASI|nr:hypothetical protein [Austropuccinia psidii MF-1]
MELIDYIDGLFTDVPSIPDYWITARLNKAFKGHASIWYTEMKEIHGRRNWPRWRSQTIQKYRNDTWIWQKTVSFGNDRYTVDKYPYHWIRTSIGRYNTHSNGDKTENPTLEAKETHDAESEITTGFNSCESPNHYSDNSPKDREEIFAREEVTRKDQERHESDPDSVGNGCGNNPYSEPSPHEEYLGNLRTMEQRKLVQSTPKEGNQ